MKAGRKIMLGLVALLCAGLTAAAQQTGSGAGVRGSDDDKGFVTDSLPDDSLAAKVRLVPAPQGMGLSAVSLPEISLRRPLSRTEEGLNVSGSELNARLNLTRYAPKNYLLRWDGGRMTGFNSIDMLPGYGSVATAGVTATHRFSDALTFNGTAQLQKNSIYYNTAAFAGMLTYELSPFASASAFATWQTPSFMSMYRTRGIYQYGGFLTLHTENKKWGVDMGSRMEQNPFTGRQEATPIVMPYYNLNGQKLGIDLGGLIKSAIISNRMRKEGMPFGPMGPMMPPPPK